MATMLAAAPMPRTRFPAGRLHGPPTTGTLAAMRHARRSQSQTTTPRCGPLATGAWVLYDLANTIYAATLTFLFTPFAKQQLGGLSGYGKTVFASMAAAAVLVPWLGALADQTARTGRYLTIATLVCITAIALWGLDLGPVALLASFFVANVSYNIALMYYNALLPSIAAPERAGRVSGLGVGVGYLGTILVLAAFVPLDVPERLRFPIAAAAFLALALPCFLFVRDHRRPQPSGGVAALRAAGSRTLAAVRELPRHRPLFWFLCGNFWLVDVLNTAVLYFADFTIEVFQSAARAGTVELLGQPFGADGDLRSFLMVMGLALNVLALLFGIVLGPLSDRSPLGVMRFSALALLLALAGGAAFGGASALGYLLTLVTLGAAGLAGIWTAGRKVIVLLAPPERVGEFFGLYGITIKLSVVGAVAYAEVADGYGARAAMLVQTIPLLLGAGCLAMVRLPTTR
jgi:MFS transporter, UMF1 family